MDFLFLLEMINYVLVFLFGLFLSIQLAGGWETKQQKRWILLTCPVLWAVQSLFWLGGGVTATERFYPLIVHLPLILILVLVQKKNLWVSLVSVSTAYLCCQLPRWIRLVFASLTEQPLLGELSYTLCIGPIFLLLRRYFVPAIHDTITYSTRTLLLFGSLPVAYYLFDYATVVYSDALYEKIHIFSEFLPTVLIVFYVIFLSAYHRILLQETHSEFQRTMLEEALKRTTTGMEILRQAETKIAIQQHDLKHHLVVLEGFLSSGSPKQAEEYIRSLRTSIDSIVPKRFCENETANLLCSSFSDQAEKMETDFRVKATLPEALSIPDTELCSMLSNGLENALRAVSKLEPVERWISLNCSIQRNKLLLEIRNPYWGTIRIQNGLPISNQPGHGYGCRSIRAIAEQHRGMCSFDAENGIFSLRIILPIAGSKL